MELLIEEERTSQAQNPEHEAELWKTKGRRLCPAAQRLPGPACCRADELGRARLQAQGFRQYLQDSGAELAALKDHRRRVQDLEQDRDALLESMAEMVPEALDSLTSEEKSRIYRMLRLEVTPTTEGTMSAALFVLL